MDFKTYLETHFIHTKDLEFVASMAKHPKCEFRENGKRCDKAAVAVESVPINIGISGPMVVKKLWVCKDHLGRGTNIIPIEKTNFNDPINKRVWSRDEELK